LEPDLTSQVLNDEDFKARQQSKVDKDRYCDVAFRLSESVI